MSNRESNFIQNSSLSSEMWLGVNNKIIYWVGITDLLGIYDESKTKTEIISEFNEWLSNNPTYVIYKLNTPTEETIILPDIPTLKYTNIITTDTTVKPSNMTVEYKSFEKGE